MRRPGGREQVHQVQGTLHFRLTPVLDVICDIEQLPHIGAVASSDILLDPVVEAEMVELVPHGCEAVVECGERSASGCFSGDARRPRVLPEL